MKNSIKLYENYAFLSLRKNLLLGMGDLYENLWELVKGKKPQGKETEAQFAILDRMTLIGDRCDAVLNEMGVRV